MRVIYIRSRRTAFARDGNPALKCNPDGFIQANTFGQGLEWEQWRLHHNVDSDDASIVALQSWTGKFLSAKPNGEVRADADRIEAWEKWRIVPSRDIFCALQSQHGKYLVCDDLFNCGNSVKADRDHIQEWEEWAIADNPHALTNPGHTLRCAIGGTLIGAGAIVTLGSLAIPLVGFEVAGVAGGSLAAAAQSAFYGGATSGIFSVLQSAGATLAWAPVAVGGVAATGTGASVLKK